MHMHGHSVHCRCSDRSVQVQCPDSVPRGRCSREDGWKLAGSRRAVRIGRPAARPTAGKAIVRRLITLLWGGCSARGDRLGTRLQGIYGCHSDQEPAEEHPRPCPGCWHSDCPYQQPLSCAHAAGRLHVPVRLIELHARANVEYDRAGCSFELSSGSQAGGLSSLVIRS